MVLNDFIPADCLVKVVNKTHEILYHKKKLEPQLAPKDTLRPNFAKDCSALSSDTTEPNTLQSEGGVQEISSQSSNLRTGKPVANVVKVAPRIDERYQVVSQAEVQNQQDRRNLISNAVHKGLVILADNVERHHT